MARLLPGADHEYAPPRGGDDGARGQPSGEGGYKEAPPPRTHSGAPASPPLVGDDAGDQAERARSWRCRPVSSSAPSIYGTAGCSDGVGSGPHTTPRLGLVARAGGGGGASVELAAGRGGPLPPALYFSINQLILIKDCRYCENLIFA